MFVKSKEKQRKAKKSKVEQSKAIIFKSQQRFLWFSKEVLEKKRPQCTVQPINNTAETPANENGELNNESLTIENSLN